MCPSVIYEWAPGRTPRRGPLHAAWLWVLGTVPPAWGFDLLWRTRSTLKGRPKEDKHMSAFSCPVSEVKRNKINTHTPTPTHSERGSLSLSSHRSTSRQPSESLPEVLMEAGAPAESGFDRAAQSSRLEQGSICSRALTERDPGPPRLGQAPVQRCAAY
ncbi:unnamed protein product [Pleuronectes platessa]|uniref:Uncharacterized protein n=1 Tax=Pleuronectes platessa TaxID=8262 RepID=A0A9N7YXM0_PLEPL|nr:unnamed protein product [Pleuronectes platessa]